MQLTVDDLAEADVRELAEVAQRPYALCLQTVSMYTDVDVAALISSSTDTSLSRYHGGAEMWHDLARKCAPLHFCLGHVLREWHCCAGHGCAVAYVQCSVWVSWSVAEGRRRPGER